jgi:hypothetical protein
MTLISLRYTSRRYDRRQSRSEEHTPWMHYQFSVNCTNGGIRT